MLENFRVFLGKNEIDFNNSDGNPADFCLHIWEKWFLEKRHYLMDQNGFFTGDIDFIKKRFKSKRR